MDHSVKIGIIGDFNSEYAAHRATNAALTHCAAAFGMNLIIQWLPTEGFDHGTDGILKSFDGLWCAPGSPYNSMTGALNAIRYARENNVPFIGTCGGFQHTFKR